MNKNGTSNLLILLKMKTSEWISWFCFSADAVSKSIVNFQFSFVYDVAISCVLL
jgi:hypothetical protein